jgi:hypothetical protein
MDNDVSATVERVRARVTTKTLIQDLSEPLTGQIDQRRIATKLNNLETAVDDLAGAVGSLNAAVEGSA